MCNDIASILNAHRRLGPRKPVSYLPIRTIESVLGLSVDEYRAMIEQSRLPLPGYSGESKLHRVR
jgi:hypothetical protein